MMYGTIERFLIHDPNAPFLAAFDHVFKANYGTIIAYRAADTSAPVKPN